MNFRRKIKISRASDTSLKARIRCDRLTGTFVDSCIDHGTEFREAGLPHDIGGALHPFGRWYRNRGGLGSCQDGTAVPAIAVWT